ncbi:hypothetical protein [Tengunoibacter tsumagoiensis]|uniref:Uncharacterized protein n=1 Tax=Tengunoibacter tsumagoiensis TaxID=2014871 RepID=A0A402A4Z9_9CHLR|nr:hypothetical protein [Tengunoibacter tsumagoiensis]GCE14180.1 hypothetical protein KTT_40390 [Tengunoibacter tsumagoiensis]GCE14234.1 hypothetical protein KTT_40930 [Tengunoibacter tsumagoiensis]
MEKFKIFYDGHTYTPQWSDDPSQKEKATIPISSIQDLASFVAKALPDDVDLSPLAKVVEKASANRENRIKKALVGIADAAVLGRPTIEIRRFILIYWRDKAYTAYGVEFVDGEEDSDGEEDARKPRVFLYDDAGGDLRHIHSSMEGLRVYLHSRDIIFHFEVI